MDPHSTSPHAISGANPVAITPFNAQLKAPLKTTASSVVSASNLKRPRGRPRKTADERDDGNRRLALLSAAAKLFRTQGFAATSTRDIAAAVGMHSGSPFYHFESKSALLFAVMEQGMRSAIERQSLAMSAFNASAVPELKASPSPQYLQSLLTVLMRNHLEILLGRDSDFVPVMLYESRSLDALQSQQITLIKDEYEAVWMPVLQALFDAGQLGCKVKLARLMIFGALNWTAQWYDPQHAGGASLDDLVAAAIALFLKPPQTTAALP